jgi:2-C-methyl-D-erythritol 4-phosphate cytidylyltransferase
MLLRALRPFTSHPDVAHVVVVLSNEHTVRPPAWLAPLVGQRLTLTAGGAARIDSVRAGLAALAPDARVVLVHDAARPFVSRTTIDAVIAAARRGVGAVAAVPVSDTVKEVDGQRRVRRTVPREGLWRAQTPQGFPRDMLEAAYATTPPAPSAHSSGIPASDLAPPTDDGELCERSGFSVEVVADTSHNFKVTTADDFVVAEAMARELR